MSAVKLNICKKQNSGFQQMPRVILNYINIFALLLNVVDVKVNVYQLLSNFCKDHNNPNKLLYLTNNDSYSLLLNTLI